MAVFILPPATVTVAYEEMILPQQSPTESGTLTSFKATRYLKCAWADRRLLSQQLKGTIKNVGADLQVVSPQQYPDVPAAGVTQVDIAPFSGGTGETLIKAKYDTAILTVQYSTNALGNIQSGGGSDAIISEDLEPWTEFLTLPGRGLFWPDGKPVAEEESPPKLFRGLTWVYRTHLQKTVSKDVLTLAGKCNDGQVLSLTLGLTFGDQELLFTPPRLSIDTDIDGNKSITIEYRFNHRPGGWNQFYRKETQQVEQMFTDTGATTQFQPYEPASFAGIVG